MSQENLELVSRAVEAFNQGGLNSDDAQAFMDDEIVFEEPPEQPAPRVARGRAEATEMFSQFEEAWEEHHTEVQELRAIDDERVLLLTIERFRGRDGIEVEQPCGSIITLSDAKIVRMQSFWEQSTALKAAADGGN
jgi:ketosteroid isomerase-like protein